VRAKGIRLEELGATTFALRPMAQPSPVGQHPFAHPDLESVRQRAPTRRSADGRPARSSHAPSGDLSHAVGNRRKASANAQPATSAVTTSSSMSA